MSRRDSAGAAETTSRPGGGELAESFGRQVLGAVGVSYLGAAVAFVGSIVVARALGAAGKGSFSLFVTTVTAIAIFSGLGVGHGQMYHASRTGGRLRHFLPNGAAAAVVLGGAGAALYFGVGHLLGIEAVTRLDWPVVVAGFLSVPALSMLIFQRQYLLTVGGYVESRANLAATQALPLLGCGVVAAIGELDLQSLIVAYVLGQIGVLALFQSRIAAPGGAGFSWSFARESFSFGLRQYVSTLTEFLSKRLDYFLVPWLLGPAALGIYSVAVALAEIVARLPAELGKMLFPAFASDDFSREQSASVVRRTTLLAVAVAVALMVLSRPVVLLMYGSEFAEAVGVLRWLLVGTVAQAAVSVTWNHTSAAGRPALGVPIFGAAVLVVAALNLALLPRIGVEGAGVAAAASYWTAAGLFVAHFCRQQGVPLRDLLLVRGSDVRWLLRVARTGAGFLVSRLRPGDARSTPADSGTEAPAAVGEPEASTPRAGSPDRAGPSARGGGGPDDADTGGEPRRVGYLLSTYPDLTETFVAREIDGLRRRGFQVVVYAIRRPGDRETERSLPPAGGRPVYARPDNLVPHLYHNLRAFLTHPVRYLRLFWRALRASGDLRAGTAARSLYHLYCGIGFGAHARRHGVEHFHCHFTPGTTAALAARSVHGLPFSFTAHASADLFVEPVLMSEKLEAAEFAVPVCDYSARYLDAITGYRFGDRLHRVYNGLDPEEANRLTEADEPPATGGAGGAADAGEAAGGKRSADGKTSYGGDALRVLSVGNLVPPKGHATLIEACALLRERGVPVRCDIVGGGPLGPTLERLLREQGLDGVVRLHGARPLADVYRLMADADVFVLLSEISASGYRDGFPTVILEAMSMSLPVVATSLSGIPEMVAEGRTGLLVRERDPDAAADALALLARDPDRRGAMGEAGRARVRSRFHIEDSLDALASLLAATAAPARRAAR